MAVDQRVVYPASEESGPGNRRRRQSSGTRNANAWCYAHSSDRYRAGVVVRWWRRLLRARSWLGTPHYSGGLLGLVLLILLILWLTGNLGGVRPIR